MKTNTIYRATVKNEQCVLETGLMQAGPGRWVVAKLVDNKNEYNGYVKLSDSVETAIHRLRGDLNALNGW